MIGFEWLDRIFDAALSFVPQIRIVTPAAVLVAFPLGRPVLCSSRNGFLKTGLHIHWPLISCLEEIPVTEQSPAVTDQLLHTDDHKPVAVQPDYSFKVRDPVRVATTFPDYEELAQMRLIAMTAEEVTASDFDSLMDAEERIEERLAESLDAIGLELCWFTLGSRQRGIPLFHWKG